MSIESVERVKEAELKAEEIKKNAEEKAKHIISDARKEARLIIEKSEIDADIKHKEIIEEAKKRAEMLYKEKIDNEREKCSKIKADGREHIGQAIDVIVRKVVNPDGNC